MQPKKGRTLSEDEAKRVQKAVRKLLETQTQEDLAKKIGFSQSQVSSAASAKRSGVSAFFAIAVAQQLGVAPNTLIDMNLITPGNMPEMPVKAFLEWLYKAPGIMATVHRYDEVTIQDLFRLRESPPRGGEADPEQIFEHIIQLRDGPIGETVPHDVVSPEALLRLLPQAPSSKPAPTQKRGKKRHRTP